MFFFFFWKMGKTVQNNMKRKKNTFMLYNYCVKAFHYFHSPNAHTHTHYRNNWQWQLLSRKVQFVSSFWLKQKKKWNENSKNRVKFTLTLCEVKPNESDNINQETYSYCCVYCICLFAYIYTHVSFGSTIKRETSKSSTEEQQKKWTRREKLFKVLFVYLPVWCSLFAAFSFLTFLWFNFSCCCCFFRFYCQIQHKNSLHRLYLLILILIWIFFYFLFWMYSFWWIHTHTLSRFFLLTC